MDSDMIFLSDIAKLLFLADDKYAVMCVKHNHMPPSGGMKMDGREQLRYHRKNWSSFVLWNCSHPANRVVTKEYVGYAQGRDMHSFSWLTDDLIGSLPTTYNYISTVSPKVTGMPDVIHYTEGGPWFPECKDVAYAGTWIEEYEDMQANGRIITEIPSIAFEKQEVIRK